MLVSVAYAVRRSLIPSVDYFIAISRKSVGQARLENKMVVRTENNQTSPIFRIAISVLSV